MMAYQGGVHTLRVNILIILSYVDNITLNIQLEKGKNAN